MEYHPGCNEMQWNTQYKTQKVWRHTTKTPSLMWKHKLSD